MFTSQAVTRCPLRRQVLYWRDRQRGVLPSDLSCAYREREERPLFSECRSSSGIGLSPLVALPARELARNSGMVRNFKHSFASLAADRGEWAGRRWGGSSRGTPG